MKRQVRPPSSTRLVDRVDRGAGGVVDDRPVLLGELVQQRGLADVGLADDRDTTRAADLGERLQAGLGQRGEDGVEHVARAAAVQGGDRVGLAQAEVPQAVGLGLGAHVVDLVRGEDHRLAGLAEDPDDGLVGVGDAHGRVHHEQHRVRDGHRHLGLRGDPLGQAAGVGVPPAGVDDREGTAVPGGVVGDAVAGDAGDVLDHGLAGPGCGSPGSTCPRWGGRPRPAPGPRRARLVELSHCSSFVTGSGPAPRRAVLP